MVWSYPDISLEDLMKLIKSFIDMLILASGYQSTGRLAHWDSCNIKKAFQWALFIENMSKGLTSSDDYKDSVKELDAALSELTSVPCFPRGLANLSWSTATLGRAANILLEHLIHTLPLRESHIKAIIEANFEMDLDVPNKKDGNLVEGDFSRHTIRELGRRQLMIECSSAAETCLEILSKSIGSGDPGNASCTEGIKNSASLIRVLHPDPPLEQLIRSSSKFDSNAAKLSIRSCFLWVRTEELPVELVVWNSWKSKSLSYMLDIRTTRLVSGASLIFSAPESQWIQMFERLNILAESDDNFYETIELLLFGCISAKWNALIEHLIQTSYRPCTISRLFNDIVNLPQGKSENLFPKEGLMKTKEKNVGNFLESVVENRIDLLWKLSPVILAVAIPTRSQLFRSYLLDLEGQLKGHSSASRCCNCITDSVEHRACEVAERIWCLHIFHVCGSTKHREQMPSGCDGHSL